MGYEIITRLYLTYEKDNSNKIIETARKLFEESLKFRKVAESEMILDVDYELDEEDLGGLKEYCLSIQGQVFEEQDEGGFNWER
jgi:hypothetical protein